MITTADLHEMRAEWIEAGRPGPDTPVGHRYRRATETAPDAVRSRHLIALPLCHDDPVILRREAQRERS